MKKNVVSIALVLMALPTVSYNLAQLACFTLLFLLALESREFLWVPRRLIGFTLILVSAVFQVLFVADESIAAHVSSETFRSSGTFGVSNRSDLNLEKLVFLYSKFICLLIMAVGLNRSLFSLSKNELKFILTRVMIIVTGINLIIFGFVEILNLGSLVRSVFGRCDENFLVGDVYGARLSIGFFEPSHMAIFVGLMVGTVLLGSSSRGETILVIAICLVNFLLSRSLTVLLVPLLLFAAFRYRWTTFLLGTITYFALMWVWRTGLVDPVGLLRSFNDRMTPPDWSSYSILLFGFQFGEVYSFTPFMSVAIQIGIVGLVGVFIIFDFNLCGLLVFLFLNMMCPQMWFTSPILTLGLIPRDAGSPESGLDLLMHGKEAKC